MSTYYLKQMRSRAPAGSAGSSFPAGVTLTAIDGGNAYYGDAGLTVAATAGWDSADFIPIAMFLEKLGDSTDLAKWQALGVNTAWAIQGEAAASTRLTLMKNNNIYLVIQSSEWLTDGGNDLFHATLQSNVVGISCADEPATVSQISSPILNVPNASQDGRLWYVNYTNNAMRFFDLGGVALDDLHDNEYPTPNATTRHLNLVGMDHYYFAGAYDDAVPSEAGACWGLGRSMTADELQRGARYKDAVQFMRTGNPNQATGPWQPTYPAPHSIYIETGAPYDQNTTTALMMRAAWIPAAVWGTIIGGARYLKYFTLGDPGSVQESGLITATAFWDTTYNGESISNYDQVAATNAQVQALASVINSPFATGYASVSPAAVVMNSSRADSGFDLMVKYHNRGAAASNKFYILAMPRYGYRTHDAAGVDTGAETWPKTATFTIANTGSTQVTVVNESRTIPVTGGGTTFSDSFATPHTVHIYRVD